jgi:DNA-binding NtrC family response regulator
MSMTMKKKNVLVIDDDSKVRQSLGRALTTENYEVVSAANGREAMRQFDENRIDVVLLDLNLGLESGWDIFENLAALKPMIPVIVITAETDPEQPSSGRVVDALMQKPLDLPVLFQLLRKLAPELSEDFHGRNNETRNPRAL